MEVDKRKHFCKKRKPYYAFAIANISLFFMMIKKKSEKSSYVLFNGCFLVIKLRNIFY